MPAKTHGYSRNTGLRGKLYRAWCHMKDRCTNENHPDFHRYGGRGIVVHDAWLHDFSAFADAVGLPPTEKHTLDRIDNDGPYAPGNCRWATVKEQNANRHVRNQAPVKTMKVLSEIKQLHANGYSTRQIATMVGLSKSQVWKAISGAYDE